MPYLEGNIQTEEEIAKNPEFIKLLAVLKNCPVAGCELADGDADGVIYKNCTHGHGAFWFVNAGPRWWVLEFDLDKDFEETVLKGE